MESLVRFIIGFMLIYQLLSIASCKVMKQRTGYEKEISENDVDYERRRGLHFNPLDIRSQVDMFDKTSIKSTNATLTSWSGLLNDSLTHIPENTELQARSFLKLKKVAYDVKRSFKKIFFAWAYYGPELGLCKCLFKYAWHTYPIVPEVTFAAMGRAKHFVSSFMVDFWQGFKESQQHTDHHSDHHRISSKVAQTTADDYFDYQTAQVQEKYSPFRRVGDFAANIPENSAPLVEKSNPQLNAVVEMLKNLQPKGNVSDFVIRMARHIQTQSRKLHNAQQFRFVSDDGDEIKYFSNHHGDDTPTVTEKATKTDSINRTNERKAEIVTTVKTKSSESVPQEAMERKFNFGSPSKVRYGPPPKPVYGPPPAYHSDPPPGLPSFNELPPADYTFFKDGIYHHVHDIRKNKQSPPVKVKGGGWFKFDFSEAILQALGVSDGRSLKPSLKKCSKSYIFSVILRFIQTAVLG